MPRDERHLDATGELSRREAVAKERKAVAKKTAARKPHTTKWTYPRGPSVQARGLRCTPEDFEEPEAQLPDSDPHRVRVRGQNAGIV